MFNETAIETFRNFLKFVKYPIIIYDSKETIDKGLPYLNKNIELMNPMSLTEEAIDYAMDKFYGSNANTYVAFRFNELMNFLRLSYPEDYCDSYIGMSMNALIDDLTSDDHGQLFQLSFVLNMNRILPILLEEARKHWAVGVYSFMSANPEGRDDVYIVEKNNGDTILVFGEVEHPNTHERHKVIRMFHPIEFVKIVSKCGAKNNWNLMFDPDNIFETDDDNA